MPFNILLLHWGYEMTRFPGPYQILRGQELLEKWNLIIGHHSHSPQPVSAYRVDDQMRLLAFSLGNFTFGMNLSKYLHGLVLKTQLGIDQAGRWLVGDVQWRSTSIYFVRSREAVIR
jgi:poly-gamma-glutamate capsule biosynthesis protein CapA/YwtB (metallophosphatase superfamily)